jgi:o-succinylbenzoate synthase
MIHLEWRPYRLVFKEEAITSRSRMLFKDTYFIRVSDDAVPNLYGVGECALFKGLSYEDCDEYENVLTRFCEDASHGVDPDFGSIIFGYESALRDLYSFGTHTLYSESSWARGRRPITINGLIWMGTRDKMFERINQKLDSGFRCLKLKIGGINFDEEVELLRYIRSEFSPERLEIRLDANGSFTPETAMARLETLSKFNIHSIEQPVKPRQHEAMARLCSESPIDIALDEELIGPHKTKAEKTEMLDFIHPQYIILKPSLCGGFKSADEWIEAAEGLDIKWWATSALESNVGLNAIAQWVDVKNPQVVQGLGTGALYTNNIQSPLTQQGPQLVYDSRLSWDDDFFDRIK